MPVSHEDSVPLIPQFFAGRAILLTGATGFMGKVLVERLLSTCPEVARLHVLLRGKAGAEPGARLRKLRQAQVFDVLRETDPDQLDKLHVVSGDITKPGLGISADSLAELLEVSVVFNCAATVRFDEPLRIAAEQNVLSIVRLMEVCDRLPGVKALVHVSTGYSNPERASIAERVYPLPSALSSMLAHALAVPDSTSNEEVNRLIFPKPNTYTYTKMLAEAAVAEHGVQGYPIAVFRPTIVTASLRHPFPGWVDSPNGPCGVIAAVSAGLLRVLQCRGSSQPDLVPVDVAIDSLIAVAWETAVDNIPLIRVYNCSTSENPTSWEELRVATVEDSRQNPLTNVAWYPSFMLVQNRFLYAIVKLLVQTIPFYVIEYFNRIFNHQKSRTDFIKVHSRLSGLTRALHVFVTREWRFSVVNMRRLRARLSPADGATFNLDPTTIDWKEYHKTFTRGCRVYLMKDKEENLPESRKRLQRIYLIHRTVTILLPILLLYQLLNPGLWDNIVRHSIHCATVILSSIGKVWDVFTSATREIFPFKIS